MINKNQKSKLNLLRKLSIIPVALIALYFFACKTLIETEQITSTNGTRSSEVATVVDEMPIFPGGVDSLMRFLSTNLRYPKVAMEDNIQGTVFLKFVVTTTGTIDEIEVVKGVDPLLDQAAIEAVKKLPAFTPGKKDGVAVPVWFQIPIAFRLTENMSAIGINAGGIIRNDTRSSDDDGIFIEVDEFPKFPGGETELMKFLNENVVYPEKAKENGIQGNVYVRFVVTATGSIGNIEIRRGVDPLLDQAAIEVIKKLPAFIPGKKDGVAVPVWYSIPISFRL